MSKLTPEGELIVQALAAQYKIGADAVKVMLDAVAKGGGGAAKFNLPEFGGPGEWMRGMPLMGGMGGDPVKATVDSLCNVLSALMAAQASLFMPASQWPASARWWPAQLGEPSSTGTRASSRYAYFAQIRRLAVDSGGRVEVYDTTGFNIEGLGPQGADGEALTFASNRGPVRLDAFPRAYGMTAPEAAPGPEAEAPTPGTGAAAPEAAPAQKPATGDAGSILMLIAQLGTLKEKGILTEEEFAAKKAELLSQL
jgi:hypothetical protein